MDVQDVAVVGAVIVGVVRAATGIVLVGFARRAGEKWVDETSLGVATLVRGIGGRDLAIGAGVVWAAIADVDPLPWVLASLLGDVFDMVAGTRLPKSVRTRVLQYAGGFAVLSIGVVALLLAA